MMLTKHNGVPVIIDDDGVMKPTTTTDEVRHEPSKRSGSPTHVCDIRDECTGLITPNGVEVPLTTLDQKRWKWWRDALINLCFITGYVDVVCWLCDGLIGIDPVQLRGLGCSKESGNDV